MKKNYRSFYILFLAVLFTSETYTQGFYKDIFIDAGIGLSKFTDLPAVESLGLSSEYVNTENQLIQDNLIAGNEYDENGVLLYPDGAPRFRLFYSNGGSSFTHGASMGAEGRDRVREFYANGGSYSGSCAGSALFSQSVLITGIIDTYYRIWPGRAIRVAVGPLEVNHNVPENSPLLKYRSFGGDNFISNVGFNFGNYAFVNSEFPPETEKLLFYDCPTQGMHTQISCWAYKKSEQSGRGVVIGCHPEAYAEGERLELAEAIFLYAIDGNGTQKIKGVLLKDNTRFMNKSTKDNDPEYTKIGDKQYHHFKFTLEDNVKNFKLILDSDEYADMNLYLKKDEPAFEEMADYSITGMGADKILEVDELSAGEYFVGVECNTTVTAVKKEVQYEYIDNLNVLNGVAYSININWGEISSVSDGGTPFNFNLFQNYPNPFNPSTTINYTLPEALDVKVEIFDMLGRSVKTLVNTRQEAGSHYSVWDATDDDNRQCSSGIYIYRLAAGEFCQQKKMILIR